MRLVNVVLGVIYSLILLGYLYFWWGWREHMDLWLPTSAAISLVSLWLWAVKYRFFISVLFLTSTAATIKAIGWADPDAAPCYVALFWASVVSWQRSHKWVT